jgi:hypothetical protein
MTITRPFRLEGSSMRPLFKPGQVALVSDAGRGPHSGLKAGDCAVYELGDKVLLHRVTGLAHEGAWFADDAGRLVPHLVPFKMIRGRVLSRNPLTRGLCGLAYCRLRRALSKLVL